MIDTAPKVSVAIVFYNAAKWLPYSIASVLCQDYDNIELILIDDGSTDASVQIVKTISDGRAYLVSDGVRRQLHVRLNQAVKLARGEFFFRMDADDVMCPGRISAQVEHLRQLPPNAVLGGAAVAITESWNILGLRNVRQGTSLWSRRHSFIHPTVAARRTWFVAHPYSEAPIYFRSEDAELWLRSARDSKYVNVSTPILFYRESERALGSYLGSSVGLIYAAMESKDISRWRKTCIALLECSKIYIHCVVHICGWDRIMQRRRAQRLTAAEREHWAVVLEACRSQTERMFPGFIGR